MGMSRFIDVSHPVAEGMETYRPLPPPRVEVLSDYDASRYEGKAEFHWGTDRYFSDNPFLTAESCERLVAAGVAFVGIDSLNIDDIADMARPAHTTLLRAGVPICEHMTNLAPVSSGGRLHAVPIAWVGGGTFPVRAYVLADE